MYNQSTGRHTEVGYKEGKSDGAERGANEATVMFCRCMIVRVAWRSWRDGEPAPVDILVCERVDVQASDKG
jgi:hypothetical protein